MKMITKFGSALLLLSFLAVSAHAQGISGTNTAENSSVFTFTANSLDELKDADTSSTLIDIGDLVINDNTDEGYQVTIDSVNGGYLKHTAYDAGKEGTYLNYALQVDLNNAIGDTGAVFVDNVADGVNDKLAMTNTITLDADSTVPNSATVEYSIPILFHILDNNNTGAHLFAGVFSDTLTVTHVD